MRPAHFLIAVLVLATSFFAQPTDRRLCASEHGSAYVRAGDPEPDTLPFPMAGDSPPLQVATPSTAASQPSLVLDPTTPLEWLYLEQYDVHVDLKLSDKQVVQLAAVGMAWQEATAKGQLALLELAQVRELLAPARMRIDVLAVLTPAQQARLNQLMFRHREATYGFAGVLPSIVKDLKITDDQRAEIDGLQQDRAEAVYKTFASKQRFADMRPAVDRINRQCLHEINETLTDEQREHVNLLRGSPFGDVIKLKAPDRFRLVGRTQASPPAGAPTRDVVPESNDSKRLYREATWDRYTYEAEVLALDSVRNELALTAKQSADVKEFQAAWRKRVDDEQTGGHDFSDAVVRTSDFVAARLKELLTPEQARRFREIMVQHQMRVSGPNAACGYPGVWKNLSFHAYVRARMQQGMLVAESIGRDEWERLKGTQGDPFPGDVAFGELRFGPLLRLTAASAMRSSEEALSPLPRLLAGNAKRFHLTEEQIRKLSRIEADFAIVHQILHEEAARPACCFSGGIVPTLTAVDLRYRFINMISDQCRQVLDQEQRVDYDRWRRGQYFEEIMSKPIQVIK